MFKVPAVSDGFYSLMGCSMPARSHIGREWCWRRATRYLMNSFTTIGAITSTSCSLANLFQTQVRRQSESFAWPQPELGEAGTPGVRSRGLHVPGSIGSHCFRNPFAAGESSKLIPEPAVAATTSKVAHPEN